MPLKLPHEYVIEAGSRQMRILAEHPTMVFHTTQQFRVGTTPRGEPIYDRNPDYHPPITYQEGYFYDTLGQELPLAKVPAYIREQVRASEARAAAAARQRQGPVRLTLEQVEAFAKGEQPDPFEEQVDVLIAAAKCPPKAPKAKPKKRKRRRAAAPVASAPPGPEPPVEAPL